MNGVDAAYFRAMCSKDLTLFQKWAYSLGSLADSPSFRLFAQSEDLIRRINTGVALDPQWMFGKS